MKHLLALLILLGQPVVAQTLIPATSEDINEFDRQVNEQLQRNAKDNKGFGAQVSEEAKKLNESDVDNKKNFGKWVSGERKKAEQGRPSAASGNGGSRGASSGGTAGNSGKVPPGKDKNKNK